MDPTAQYSPLTTFVELGKNAKNLAAAKNIERAVSHKNTFVFGELLDLKNVQDLHGTQHTKFLSLLQLFAYGTYKDYVTNTATLPSLTEFQLRKLKKLSIISMTTDGTDILPYALLLKELDIPNIRELEDLIIEAVYSGIIDASLDQKEQHVHVHTSIGRDAAPGQLGKMIEKLDKWTHTAKTLLSSMDGEINEALEKWNAEEEKKRKFEATWNRAHALAIENKEQNRSDHDGSNTSADYYGDGSSWSNSSSIRRGKGSTTSGLGGRTK